MTAPAPAAPPDPRFHRTTVEAGGVRFNAVYGPPGRPLLLLHGWPLTWWSWRKVLAPLADAGFHVIAPDLPGLGDSGPSPVGYEKRAIVEPLRALMQAIGHPRFLLAGHDMGAPIAYAWARLYPDEVERLAILDVPLNGFGLDAFAKRLGLWHFDFFAAPELPEALIDGRERALIEHFYPAYAPDAITPADVDEYARTYTRPEVTAAGLAYYRAMKADEAWMTGAAARQKLAMPVLALSGEYAGNYSPFESMAQLATNVRGTLIPGCGHYLAEEKPAETAAALIDFFTGDLP
jgi:pimeloyl-ACP methyl ester carboxylesterase